MEKLFARIKNGVVVDVIVGKKSGLAPIFHVGFDSVIEVTEHEVKPGKGWAHDGIEFVSPRGKKASELKARKDALKEELKNKPKEV